MFNKIKAYIKRYNFTSFLIKTAGTIIFYPIIAIYRWYLNNFTKIDSHRIVFASVPSMSDNSKTLYEWMKERKLEFTYVWLVKDDFKKDDYKKIEEENNIIIVKQNSKFYKGYSLKSMYFTAASKYIFFTHNSPIGSLKIKKDQIVINLWHGCGYKEANSLKESFDKKNPFDYVLVPGNIFIKTKMKSWGCNENMILPIGYPRYDLFFSENNNAKKFMKDIAKERKKTIIWMPTFRKTDHYNLVEYDSDHHNEYDIPLLNSNEELQILNDFCADKNILLIIKRHPYQKKYEGESFRFQNIIFMSSEDFSHNEVDLYCFLKYTDALISDYSSVAFDYLLLNKPIAFSLDDYEKYKNKRGFIFENPLDYMPGHHLYTFEDLKDFIQDVVDGKDPYTEDRKKLIPIVHNPCDDYCERIWNKVLELSSEQE